MTNDPDIRVLYVNDDDQLLELVSTQLTTESDRLSVVTADSVERGQDILSESAVDCILCDYHMTEQTGVEFLERVREEYPDIPFLLFTETGSEKVASESIEAGVTDYIIQEAIGNQAPLLVQKIQTYVEHRRSKREIEKTDERLREIVSVTDQVVWVYSPDWSELRFINDGHEGMFGQSAEELRAEPTSFLEKVPDEDTERVKLAMKRASAGESQIVEYRYDKSDSIQVWVESRCKPVTDDSGTVQSIVGLSREITDRKTYERELLQKANQLEEFSSTVAHDLRNPVNVADGYIRLAAREHESEHLETALDAVHRMDTLIDELLTLAKEGDLVGERRHVEFAELVATSYENIDAPETSLEVSASIPVECDPNRIIQAFENIVRNAVEHGASDVTLTAGVLDERRGVYIEDDGPGIPAAERENIFEKGYTTTKSGSGFGLAIVERVITGHGWDIEVAESTAGGARFEITMAA